MIYTSALECKHVTWHLLKKSKKCWARLQKAKQWLPSTSSSSLYYMICIVFLSTLCKKNRKEGHNNSSPCCHFVLACSSYEGHLVQFVRPCVSCCSLWTRRIHWSHQLCFKFLCNRTVRKECIAADNRTWWKGYQAQGCPSRKDGRSGELGFLTGSIGHVL